MPSSKEISFRKESNNKCLKRKVKIFTWDRWAQNWKIMKQYKTTFRLENSKSIPPNKSLLLGFRKKSQTKTNIKSIMHKITAFSRIRLSWGISISQYLVWMDKIRSITSSLIRIHKVSREIYAPKWHLPSIFLWSRCGKSKEIISRQHNLEKQVQLDL